MEPIDLSDFDFDELESMKSKPVYPCPKCGACEDGLRGCFCSGVRIKILDEPHCVYVPEDDGFNINPDPRADFTASVLPDYAKYNVMLDEAYAAKPHIQDFIREFNWSDGSTADFIKDVETLRELPEVAKLLDNLTKARDPYENFTNKVENVTPSFAHRFDPKIHVVRKNSKFLNSLPNSEEPTGCCGKRGSYPPTHLGYVVHHWFEKSLAHFKNYIAYMQRDNAYRTIRVFTEIPYVANRIKEGLGLDGLELCYDYQDANLYVFGADSYQPSIAYFLKNVWGLGFDGSIRSIQGAADASIDNQGIVHIRVPFSVGGRGSIARATYYHDTSLMSYRGFFHHVPEGRYHFMPSAVFDDPWVEHVYDPILGYAKKEIKSSAWGCSVGVISSYFSHKVTQFDKPLNERVMCHSAEGVDHGLLNPVFRSPIGGCPEVETEPFPEEYVFDWKQGDQLCHWSLYVAKTYVSLVIRAKSRSIRRHLVGDFFGGAAYHGFAILSLDNKLTNPVCYVDGGKPGSSPINCLSSKLFNCLEVLGGWAYRPSRKYSEILHYKSMFGRIDFWIVSCLHSGSWLVDNGSWYAPICRLDMKDQRVFRYYHPPSTDSLSFQLWVSAVNTEPLTKYDLNWKVEAELSKRSRGDSN